MSCAAPGISRSSFGSRRSIFICDWPLDAAPDFFAPRRRRSMATMPVASTDMSTRPSRVSFTTSLDETQHSIASQCARRAASAGSTSRMWSSRNSMVATTMSPVAMSAWHVASAPASCDHSSAACTMTRRPGISACSVASARAIAVAM